MNGGRWLKWAAVITWLVVSLPTAADVVAGRMPPPVAVMWSVAALLFGVFLAACLWPARLTAGHRLVLLLLQAACGLGMVWIRPQGAAAATLVIVAAQLPYVLRPPATWLWVLTQTICIVLAAAPMARLLDRFSIA